MRSTAPRRSVHQASFLKVLCHALVRSTTHRAVACRGAGAPRLEMQASRPRRCSSVRVARVQIHHTFTHAFPASEEITVEWGGVARAQNVAALTSPRSAWHTVTSGTFGSGDGVMEPDVYAVLPRGLYSYEPVGHSLELAVAKDLRGLTGYQDFAGDVPLDLVYVADMSRMRDVPAQQRETFAAACAGAMVQNVYLFCASAGLAVAARGWFDRSVLAEHMRLARDCMPVLAQTVGYPSPSRT